MKGLSSQNAALKLFLVASGIFAVNLCLKLIHLGSQDIAMDEPFTIFWAQQPVSEIWALAKNENNPPLHFLIEHFWIKLFGMGPMSVRFPSLIFSSLAAALMFGVAHRRFGWSAGWGASLIFTLSTEQVYHSHEARTYALLSLLTVLSLGSFLRVLEDPRRAGGYLLLGLWNVLIVYSHFLGIWMLLAQAMVAVIVADRRVVAPRMALMYTGILLAYSPNLFAFVLRLKSVAAHPTWVPKPHWTQLYGHINIFWNGRWATMAFLATVVLGVAWGIVRGKRDFIPSMEQAPRRAWTVVVLIFGTVYLGIYIQSLCFTPAFIPRYLVWVSIPFFLSVSGCIALLFQDRRLQLGAFALIGLAMAPGFSLNPGNDRDHRSMMAYVKQWQGPRSMVVLAPAYFDKTYVYHANLAVFQDYAHWSAGVKAMGVHPVNGFSSLPKESLEAASRVIFVDADVQSVYPGNGIREGLEQQFHLEESRTFEKEMKVWVFRK